MFATDWTSPRVSSFSVSFSVSPNTVLQINSCFFISERNLEGSTDSELLVGASSGCAITLQISQKTILSIFLPSENEVRLPHNFLNPEPVVSAQQRFF
jgi:hypothetical protein